MKLREAVAGTALLVSVSTACSSEAARNVATSDPVALAAEDNQALFSAREAIVRRFPSLSETKLVIVGEAGQYYCPPKPPPLLPNPTPKPGPRLTGPSYCFTTDKVIIPVKEYVLSKEALSREKLIPDQKLTRVLAYLVIGHEFGHARQLRTVPFNKLVPQNPVDPTYAQRVERQREVDADCMLGRFALKAGWPVSLLAHILETMGAETENSIDPHGTGVERVAQLKRGAAGKPCLFDN